jgi:hypothetical protein
MVVVTIVVPCYENGVPISILTYSPNKPHPQFTTVACWVVIHLIGMKRAVRTPQPHIFITKPRCLGIVQFQSIHLLGCLVAEVPPVVRGYLLLRRCQDRILGKEVLDTARTIQVRED